METRADHIESISNQIKQLDYLERIAILEKIISLLKKENKTKQQVKLSSINGLGSEIWQNVYIDKYIENERQWD
ncbi:MAG: hypothetical protein COW65_02455 [Cytophagales bacterium CG18_big_fil_WC_8_21_14_2_50_42_9]|nr:MAG: hypothetical protein COW65_02455 [Cytophagales bacterium CG18_big_fil_WC_8_21_14_2_50_42_9]